MSKTKQHFPMEIPQVTGEFLSTLEAVVGILETDAVGSAEYEKAFEWMKINWDYIDKWAYAVDISQLQSTHLADKELAKRWFVVNDAISSRESVDVLSELDDILDTEDEAERSAKWEAFFGGEE